MGIMKLLQEAGASVKQLKINTEEVAKDMAAAQLLQPHSVRPTRRSTTFRRNWKSSVLSSTWPRRPLERHPLLALTQPLVAFTQIRLLEGAMEDRFARMQIQVERVGGGHPCVDG